MPDISARHDFSNCADNCAIPELVGLLVPGGASLDSSGRSIRVTRESMGPNTHLSVKGYAGLSSHQNSACWVGCDPKAKVPAACIAGRFVRTPLITTETVTGPDPTRFSVPR